MARRPNILFLMSDEHRADVSGFEGNAVVRTPVLDELARTGIVFHNAYTPSPICIPARQCLMSGQLPKTCGCEGWQDLEPGHMTFARLFAQYAYETAAFGKLHHQGSDQMQGWTQRPVRPPDLLVGRFLDGRREEEFARYERPFASYKWSQAKEIRRAGAGRSHTDSWDSLAVAGAEHFIDEYFNSPYYDREQRQQPLLLKVSLAQPHYPYLADEKRFGYYLNRVQPFFDQTPPEHAALGRIKVEPGVDVSPRELRRAVAAYYSMIERIDSYYGRILEALAQVGEKLDEWIVIYTSDHGEMLGEHGVWEKQVFYEGSVRVPLIVRWPARFEGGRVVQENVNLCDLFATLCDLAGIARPSGLDSRSLTALMQGDGHVWDNETISQFRESELMIKRGALKYQYYGEAMAEVLFDLKRDDLERENFIGDPLYAADVAAFRRRRAELGHGPDAVRDYVNAGYQSNLRRQ